MTPSRSRAALRRLVVGVISDTHGLVRPEALVALHGCDLLVHAGDVGSPEVLDALRRLGPVHAVRGNVDRGAWARALPETEIVAAGEARLYVLHNVHDLDLDPAAAGFHAVISGHSHRPGIETRGNVLYVNPGSAGPRRFTLPIAVGRITVDGSRLDARLIELVARAPSGAC